MSAADTRKLIRVDYRASTEGLTAEPSWKDVDQPAQTAKPMQFWLRDIAR